MSAASWSLLLALPCPRCDAQPGEMCVRLDGERRTRPHVKRTPAAPCGTDGGYQRHRRAGEEPCDECREAKRRYMAEYRNRRPAYRERSIDALHVRREATKVLIERHRVEFDALLKELSA